MDWCLCVSGSTGAHMSAVEIVPSLVGGTVLRVSGINGAPMSVVGMVPLYQWVEWCPYISGRNGAFISVGVIVPLCQR